MIEERIPKVVTANDSGTSGRITLEVGLRFSESGPIWTQTPDGTTNPLEALLPMALDGGGELVARYPGDSRWQLLTFRHG